LVDKLIIYVAIIIWKTAEYPEVRNSLCRSAEIEERGIERCTGTILRLPS